MTKAAIRRNPCLDAILAEFEAYGITDYDVNQNGPHLKVRWQHQSHHNQLSFPKSPSDWRAPFNIRSTLREQLRGAGIPRLSDLVEHPKATRLPLGIQPSVEIDEKVRRLAAEVGSITDWLLDVIPAIQKIEQFAGMADIVEAESGNLKFRLRADIPPSIVGPLIAYLLTQGIGMESVKISHIPFQAISAPEEKPYPRIALPAKIEQITIPAPHLPLVTEAAPLPAKERLSVQSGPLGHTRKNGTARAMLLSYLNEYGAQTPEQLRSAGVKGYADRIDRLSMLLSHLARQETPLIRRNQENAFELTPEGKALFKKLPRANGAK